MMNAIHNQPLPIPLTASPGASPHQATTAEGGSFKDFLLGSIREVNAMQADANKAVEALSSGENVHPAEVLTAVQKADLAFRTMMQVRNKIVQAYEEVKNIRV